MSTRSVQSRFTKSAGYISARKDLQESMTGRRYYGPVATQISYTKSWYRKNTAEIEAIFSRMITNVTKDKLAPSVAIDSAIRDINALE